MNRSALAGVGIGIILVATQPPSSAQAGQNLQIKATTVDDVRMWSSYVSERERSGDLRSKSVDRDSMLPSRTIERLRQFHRGVPIWGAEVVRDIEDGSVLSIFGELTPDLDLSVEPGLSTAAISQAIRRSADPDAELVTQPTLMILRLDSGEMRLTYTAIVSGNRIAARVFVDAASGSELLRVSEIRDQTTVGTGNGVLGDLKKVSVSQEAGNYYADDKLRPPVLQTFDMRGSFARTLNVAFNGAPLFASDRASDVDNDWNDSVAVDAHAHIGWTYDYYFRRFSRRGLDNRDRPLVALINGLTPQAGLLVSNDDFGSFVVNAFWCDTCGPNRVGVMFFGNGIPPQYVTTSSRQTVAPLAASLDIIAHELTHGVTSSTSGLIGRNESGALDEAFSDVMGTSVEFFYQTPGTGIRQADYLIGEDSFRGPQNGIRSLENPQAYFLSPDHYSRRYTGIGDSGGVHINAGIPGNAFYLAIEGGANRTSGLTVQGVGASNREQIEKVFYRAFTLLMPNNATFSTARAATARAAQDLYGTGGAVERAVTQAWSAVGVF